MASFPSISQGRPFLYPVTRTKTMPTRVLSFLGDQEQRWIAQPATAKFTLVYTGCDGYSVSVLKQFWESQGGASTSEFDLTLDGTTYRHLLFENDAFSVTQTAPQRFNVTLQIRQTRV